MTETTLSPKLVTISVDKSVRINEKNESEYTHTIILQVFSSLTNQRLYNESIVILEDGGLGHCLYMDLQLGISVACSATMKADKSTLCVSLHLLGVNALHILARGINVQVDLGKGTVPVDGVSIVAQSFSLTGGTAATISSATQASQLPQVIVNNLPAIESTPSLTQCVIDQGTSAPVDVPDDVTSQAVNNSNSSQQAHDAASSAQNAEPQQVEHAPAVSASSTTTTAEEFTIPGPMEAWFVPPRNPQDQHAALFYRGSVSLVRTLVYMMGIGEQYGVHAPHPTMECVAPLGMCTYHPIHAYFKALFGEAPGRCFKCLHTASSYTHTRRSALSIRHLLSLCNACDTCEKPVCIRTFPRLRQERPKKGSKIDPTLLPSGFNERSSSSAAKFLPVVPRLQELFYRLYCGANFKLDGPLSTVAQLFSFSPAFPKKLLLPDFTDKEFFQQAKKPCGGLSHLVKPSQASSALKMEDLGSDNHPAAVVDVAASKKRKVDDADLLANSNSTTGYAPSKRGAETYSDVSILFQSSNGGAQFSQAQLSFPPSVQVSDLTKVEQGERSLDPNQTLQDFLNKRFTDVDLLTTTGATNTTALVGSVNAETALPPRKEASSRKKQVATKPARSSQGAVLGPSSNTKAPVSAEEVSPQCDNSADNKRGDKKSKVVAQDQRGGTSGVGKSDTNKGGAGSQSQEAEAQSLISALLSLGARETSAT